MTIGLLYRKTSAPEELYIRQFALLALPVRIN